MRITFCGTAAGFYTPERACCGIVLQHDGRTVMLDCGQGSIRQALGAGIAIDSIEAVLLSHLHYDHAIDLATFAHNSRFRHTSMPAVYGPPSTLAFVAAAVAYVAATPLRRPIALPETVEIVASDEREICGFLVRSEETPHAPEVQAFARRLTAGGLTVVYSGDTQPNPKTIVPLSEGADVLVHEAFSEPMLAREAAVRPAELRERLYTGFAKTHTEVRQAAAIARDASVRRLVLTHLMPLEDPAELRTLAADLFKGEIIVAQDGLVIDL